MAQPTPTPPNVLLKRKVSVGAEEEQEGSKNVKRSRICPRAVLEDLKEYRIRPDTIIFNETGTRKQGASADVELATLRLSSFDQMTYGSDKMFVAVKKFRLSDDKGDERVLASLAHEISLTSELNNDHVIHLVGFAENIEENVAWIIHRWEANGNVREFLNSGAWEIPERVSLIYDISCGIKYLHTRDTPIYHGDLKSANILVNSQNRAVITDFGSARYLDESTPPRARVQKPATIPSGSLIEQPNLNTISVRFEFCSIGTLITLTGTAWTLRWAAPELVNDEHPCLGSDIWAFAWLCWEAGYKGFVMTRQIPFHDEMNDLKLMAQLATRSFNLPSIVNHEQLSQIQMLCRLINNCWSLDVDGRPTADACLSELECMARAIPANRNGQSIGGVKSIQLLDALGHLDLANGKVDEAVGYFDKELELARSGRGILRVLESQVNTGKVQHFRNCHPETEARYSLFRESEKRLYGTSTTRRLREDQIRQSQYKRIEVSYNDAKKAYERIGNQTGTARTSTRLAEVQLLKNDYVKAEAFYSEAHIIYGEVGDQPSVAQVAQALGEVQYLQKDLIKAGASYGEAREIYDRIGNEIGIARISELLGEALWAQERYTEAQDSFTRARAVYSRIEDRVGVVSATRRLGDVQLAQGRYSEAEASYIKARDLYHEIGDQLGAEDATRRLADAIRRLGDGQLARYEHAKAETSYIRAQDISREVGDEAGVAHAIRRLGEIQLVRYKRAKAAALYNKAGDISRGIADQAGVADATGIFYDIQRARNEYVQAEASYGKARDIYHEIRDLNGVADATRKIAATARRLGEVQQDWGQHAEAEVSYIKAKNLYWEVGEWVGVADVTSKLGDAQLHQGKHAEAEVSFSNARNRYRQVGDRAGVAKATRDLGDAQLKQRKYADAEVSFAKARDTYREIGDRAGVARATQSLGDAQLNQDKHADAEVSYSNARDTYSEIGDRSGVARATRDLGDAQLNQRKYC
ncbi:hypothetical protein FS837_002110, partial [Tulasnella sp. UAMH 9824]